MVSASEIIAVSNRLCSIPRASNERPSPLAPNESNDRNVAKKRQTCQIPGGFDGWDKHDKQNKRVEQGCFEIKIPSLVLGG